MIKGFNGIRAFAVLMVLVTHFKLTDYVFFGHDFSSIIHGTIGVYLFFTLSGFLITHLLLIEYENNHKINYKYFIIRRALRLLPVMLLYCITIFILTLFGLIANNFYSLIFAITYTTNYSPRIYFSPFLYHFWSLCVEEHFYIFYPLMFLFVKMKHVILFLFFMIVLCAIIKVLQVNYIIYNKELTDNYRWTIPAVYSILVGSITSILIKNYANIKLFLQAKGAIVLIVGIMLFVNPIFLKASMVEKLALNYFIQSIGIVLIILYVFYNQESILTKTFEYPLLSYIGKISYGLYIWHVLFSELAVENKINNYIAIVLSFIVSIVSFHTIETYFLSKKISFKKIN